MKNLKTSAVGELSSRRSVQWPWLWGCYTHPIYALTNTII